MAKKILWCAAVVVAVVIGYVILGALQPVVVELSGVAANMTDNETHPAEYAVLKSAPLWIYFLPAVLGLAMIVIILRAKESN